MSARFSSLVSLALENVAAHALAYAVAAAPLLATLAPWLAGAAVGEGLRREARAAAQAGPDVLIAGRSFGRAVPLALSTGEAADELAGDPTGRLRAEPGVTRVERRLVATVSTSDVTASAAALPEAPLVLVAVESARLAAGGPFAEGRAPDGPGQCVIGGELARERGLRAGSRLALDAARTGVFEVAGVLAASDALAGSRAIVVSLADAAELFGDARATELCVWTVAGREPAIAQAAARLIDGSVATTRAEVLARIDAAAERRDGALALFLAPLVLCAAACFAALSWFVQARRAPEVATLKLAGFTGGDVALLALVENLVVALFTALGAFALAWIWVRPLGAPLLSGFFAPDLGLASLQSLPAAFTAPPLLLALAATLSVTICASVLASWRLSLARPLAAFA